LVQKLQSDPKGLDIEHITKDQERYIEMVILLLRDKRFLINHPLQNLDFGVFDSDSESDSDDSDSKTNLVEDNLSLGKPEDTTKRFPSIVVLNSDQHDIDSKGF
jgi:hypothetical protein